MSIPRMSPGETVGEDYMRPVEFEAQPVCDVSDTLRELRLVLFTEPQKAHHTLGIAAIEVDNAAVVQVTPTEILHRIFDGDRNGMCVIDPLGFMEGTGAELVHEPISIGEILEQEERGRRRVEGQLKERGEWIELDEDAPVEGIEELGDDEDEEEGER